MKIKTNLIKNKSVFNLWVGAALVPVGTQHIYQIMAIEKVNQIEVLVAGQYVKRDDFDKLANAIFAKLDKISDKIDSKADR